MSAQPLKPNDPPPGELRSARDARQLLRQWYSRSQGLLLQAAIQKHLQRMIPNLFGYYALQVGCLDPETDLLECSRIGGRFCMDLGSGRQHVSGRPEALPVATDSLDLVLLAHVLESSADPHQVLREVERVLRVDGHVIIIGFNPLSPLGIWNMVPGMRSRRPWSANCHGPARIREWLALLGFEVIRTHYAGLRPRPDSGGFRARLACLETLGGSQWPYVGAAYVIQARKRVSTLTPVHQTQIWRRRRNTLSSGLVRPVCKGNGS